MTRPRRRPAVRLLKGVAVIATLVVLAVVTTIGLLWSEHRTDLTLPAPTGPFAVGRTSYDWIDRSRADVLAPDPGRQRELAVWVWYPADPATGSGPADYLPAPWRSALADHQGALVGSVLTRDPALVHAHSIADPQLAPDRDTYPVVLLRSGIGALATDYTTLAEDLASHGYVVVGMDAPYSTSVVVFPDGRVVTRTPAGNPGDSSLPPDEQRTAAEALVAVWSADTRFVLDELERLDAHDPAGRFAHRLDLGAVGVVGHSFGGATAAQFCHDDARCRAGIDLDGAPYGSVVQDGLDRPFLFLSSDHAATPDPADAAITADIESIYRSLPADQRFRMAITGTGHFNFSDQSLLKDGSLARLFGAIGTIDQRRGLTVIAGTVRQFFDTYLAATSRDFAGPVSSDYPEVRPDG